MRKHNIILPAQRNPLKNVMLRKNILSAEVCCMTVSDKTRSFVKSSIVKIVYSKLVTGLFICALIIALWNRKWQHFYWFSTSQKACFRDVTVYIAKEICIRNRSFCFRPQLVKPFHRFSCSNDAALLKCIIGLFDNVNTFLHKQCSCWFPWAYP